jgi:hypothetical protein
MIFRIVAPFCTTLTHFKPPCHLVGQPFSEIKLKKNSGRFGYDYLIYCGSLLFFETPSPLSSAMEAGGASRRGRISPQVYDTLAARSALPFARIPM